MGEEKSRLRQRISNLETERDKHVKRVLNERGPLIRGTIGERSRRCGHPGCRCAQGELHTSKYLSVTVEGRTRQLHLPFKEEQRVKRATERYRRFRRARSQLVHLAEEQLSLIDSLGDALLESYPPDDPIPPAGRRGPRPKKKPSSRSKE
jgi:hypothetical protein